jgi:hypothetical protein
MNLKRYYHGLFQAENMMKTLQKQPDLIFNQIFCKKSA